MSGSTIDQDPISGLKTCQKAYHITDLDFHPEGDQKPGVQLRKYAKIPFLGRLISWLVFQFASDKNIKAKADLLAAFYKHADGELCDGIVKKNIDSVSDDLKALKTYRFAVEKLFTDAKIAPQLENTLEQWGKKQIACLSQIDLATVALDKTDALQKKKLLLLVSTIYDVYLLSLGQEISDKSPCESLLHKARLIDELLSIEANLKELTPLKLANKTLFNSLKEHMDQILDGKITDGSIIKNCFQAIEKVIWEGYSPEIAPSKLIDSWDLARQAETFLSFFPSLADPAIRAQIRLKAMGIFGDSSLEINTRKARLLDLIKDHAEESIDDFSDLDTVLEGRLVELKDEWRSVLRGHDKKRKIDKDKILKELESKPLERFPEQERKEVQTLKYLAALNFSLMPADVQREIFKLLSFSDLKNLRKVSKAWKSLIDPVWLSNHRIVFKQCIENLVFSLEDQKQQKAIAELKEIALSLDLPKPQGQDSRAYVLEKAHDIAFALAGAENMAAQKLHKIYQDAQLSRIIPDFPKHWAYFYQLISAFKEIRRIQQNAFANPVAMNTIRMAKTAIERVGLKNILFAIKHKPIPVIESFMDKLSRCMTISRDTLTICANSSPAILELSLKKWIPHLSPNYVDIVLSILPKLQSEEARISLKNALITTLLKGRTKSSSLALKVIQTLDPENRDQQLVVYVESMIRSDFQSAFQNAFNIQDLSLREFAFKKIAESTDQLDPLLKALKQIQNPESRQNIAKQKFSSFMQKNQIDKAQELFYGIASSEAQKELLKLYPHLNWIVEKPS